MFNTSAKNRCPEDKYIIFTPQTRERMVNIGGELVHDD